MPRRKRPASGVAPPARNAKKARPNPEAIAAAVYVLGSVFGLDDGRDSESSPSPAPSPHRDLTPVLPEPVPSPAPANPPGPPAIDWTVVCLRCAKSTWMKLPDGSIGRSPVSCVIPRPGQKCTKCARKGKTCDPVPPPFRAAVGSLQKLEGGDDALKETKDFSKGVEVRMNKTKKTDPSLRVLRSLNRNLFRTMNVLRVAVGEPELGPEEEVWMDDLNEEDDGDVRKNNLPPPVARRGQRGSIQGPTYDFFGSD